MQPPNHVGYWLSRAFRAVSAAAAETLRAECARLGKRYVVSPPQWGVLTTLAVQGQQTIGALSQLLAVETPAVTGVVSRLEHSGLAQRTHDEADRRVVWVSLTAEGRRMVRALNPLMASLNAQLLPPAQAPACLAQLQDVISRAAALTPTRGATALAASSAVPAEMP